MKKATIKYFLSNSFAKSSPRRLRVFLYKSVGIRNSEMIRRNVYISNPDALIIGKNTFINRGCKFYNGLDKNGNGVVRIGRNVSIGFDSTFITVTHKIGPAEWRANHTKEILKSISIGDGVWICANVTILPGVTIGNGCVIAAGSVVVKDCKSNCMYGGNPAKLIKRLD